MTLVETTVTSFHVTTSRSRRIAISSASTILARWCASLASGAMAGFRVESVDGLMYFFFAGGVRLIDVLYLGKFVILCRQYLYIQREINAYLCYFMLYIYIFFFIFDIC